MTTYDYLIWSLIGITIVIALCTISMITTTVYTLVWHRNHRRYEKIKQEQQKEEQLEKDQIWRVWVGRRMPNGNIHRDYTIYKVTGVTPQSQLTDDRVLQSFEIEELKNARDYT